MYDTLTELSDLKLGEMDVIGPAIVAGAAQSEAASANPDRAFLTEASTDSMADAT